VSEITEFVKDEVYPCIDAVSANWLNHLNPKPGKQGNAYSLDCPKCENPQRAFYYPGSAYIVCNRKNACHAKKGPTSIWDLLSKQGNSQSDILNMLCSEANVTPPSKNNSTPNAPSKINPSKAIIQVTRKLAKDNPNIISAFARERGYSEKEMHQMDLGYYPSAEIVSRELRALNADIERCVTLGYLPDDRGYDAFKGRIVGFWKQDDLSVSLWGRSPSKASGSHKKKYRFTSGQSKSYPYLFDKYVDGPVVALEGVFDAWSVRFAGQYRSVAVGGSLINLAQCEFLLKSGIREVIHMIDPDNAGLQGALSSIRNGSKVGLRVYIAVLPRNAGDADELREHGRLDVIRDSIEKAYSPGEFVARYYIKEIEADNNYNCRLAMSAYRSMVTQDKVRFQGICTELGYSILPEADAIKALSSLLDGGMDLANAFNMIKKTHKYVISMEEA
jgi:DNA primase